MIYKARLLISFFFLISLSRGYSQDVEILKAGIESILENKNALVGVSISTMEGQELMSINGNEHFPMQSVFKFPIALAILAQVDKGAFLLEQTIEIKKAELLPGLWSPIREKYPEGVSLSLAEIIKYTVSLSDNVGCDVLIRLLGGPQQVEGYFSTLDFKDFSVKINEETMQNNWDLQFLNWTTPSEANRILQTFYANQENLLSEVNHDFIWDVMKSTQTGKRRIRGQLPAETVVAHKTGWSGANKQTGITAAINDIGIVFLPNGRYFIISVFVSQSKETFETNEQIISDISKLAWDYFLNRR